MLTSKSINCTFQLVFHTDIVCILVRSKVTYSSRRQTKAVKYHQSHPDHLMRCENIEITTSHVWHCFDSITGKQFTFLLLSYMHRRWKGWLHTGKQTRDMFLFPFLYINSTEKCGLYYIIYLNTKDNRSMWYFTCWMSSRLLVIILLKIEKIFNENSS